MLTLDKIYHAKFILKQVARKTDLIAAPRLCPGTDLYLKTENLQVTGSFKVRGAYYKISQLSEEERAKGVIACSAGNHAQGVALAATRMGIKSVVCMPDGAPIMKVESTKRLGAEVELVKGTYDDAHDRAVELQEQTGMTFIHPYDDELVIAGQGTIGLEILDQLPDVDAVIVPIGGGGLISGVAFAIKSLRPEVKVYGVQAAGAPSMEHAFHDHKYETLDSAVTFADGIAVKTPGETTFEMVSQYVDDIVTVSEDEIAAAILALMENQKLVAEGAGATPVAAALFGKLPLAGKKTVCLISGGNIDVNILSRVITHDRSDANMAITSCFLKLGLETRDAAQIETIKQKLTEAGFKLVTERASFLCYVGANIVRPRKLCGSADFPGRRGRRPLRVGADSISARGCFCRRERARASIVRPYRVEKFYTLTPAASSSTNCLATRGLRPPARRAKAAPLIKS